MIDTKRKLGTSCFISIQDYKSSHAKEREAAVSKPTPVRNFWNEMDIVVWLKTARVDERMSHEVNFCFFWVGNSSLGEKCKKQFLFHFTEFWARLLNIRYHATNQVSCPIVVNYRSDLVLKLHSEAYR